MARDRKEALKDLLKKLHAGASAEQIKEEFKKTLGDVPPTELAQAEEELIKEGMPREEIQRFCDVHLAALRESLERREVSAPPGHPVYILVEEHRILLKFSEELKTIAQELKGAKGFASVRGRMQQVAEIAHHFKEAERHYVREENVLFPTLEKHSITQPPAIMWMEHDRIREVKRGLYRLIEGHENMAFADFARQLADTAGSVADLLSSHFYKENNILFPTALQVVGESEWSDIRQQFDELGYCCFTPEAAKIAFKEVTTPVSQPAAEDIISLASGALSIEEVDAILDTLPLDITFVDKDD
ncbi:MAG TPA: DUF438 domain-containing protein, partial [Dehalococcoidia bacterium]|nr:DUF438 domain-containing protein [Dehalococcoidia bacterium]